MIAIVDYGMGNLGSIQNMFKRIGQPCRITSSADELAAASKILLPGVGAFDSAMQRINDSGLRDVLEHKAMKERVPTLGICLGMQLLTRGSDEGRIPGLGWIEGATVRLPTIPGLKVPHMGWNVVVPARSNPLIDGLPAHARFYFVHSYCVHVDDPKDSLLTAHYGVTFDAAVAHDNIYGAQFHPEKSHKFGMQLLSAFAAI